MLKPTIEFRWAMIPLGKESALARVKEAGRQAGLWGSPRDANPYLRAPSMTEERAAWSAGHAVGAAERRRKEK